MSPSLLHLLDKHNNQTQARSVSVRIRQESVGPGRTGVALWNSSLLLTRFLDRVTATKPDWLENKSVIELGCGTGLLSIALSKLSNGLAKRVVATDGNPAVLELARSNVEANGIDVETEALQWSALDAADYYDEADLVAGSDLTYNSAAWKQLAETMATVLKPGGIVVYMTLGHSGLSTPAEVDGFLQVASSEGLERIDSIAGITDLNGVLRSCIRTRDEASIVTSSGGLGLLVLTRKR